MVYRVPNMLLSVGQNLLRNGVLARDLAICIMLGVSSNLVAAEYGGPW
jgi:Na+-translocating ferredoxin:NAD+ oxidoreductase RnfA subunit